MTKPRTLLAVTAAFVVTAIVASGCGGAHHRAADAISSSPVPTPTPIPVAASTPVVTQSDTSAPASLAPASAVQSAPASSAVASTLTSPVASTSPLAIEASGAGSCDLLGPYFVESTDGNNVVIYDDNHNQLVDSASLSVSGEDSAAGVYQAQDGTPVVLISSSETTPASGLTPASTAYALSAYGLTGTQLWSVNATLGATSAPGATVTPFTPVIGAPGGVLVSNGAYVAQLRMADGKELWVKAAGENSRPETATDGHLLFAQVTAPTGNTSTRIFTAFNAVTGAAVGTIPLTPGDRIQLYPVGSTAELELGNGSVVSSFDGSVIWRPGQNWNVRAYDPVAHVLVAFDQQGNLLGADPTGRRLWSVPAAQVSGVGLQITRADNGYATGVTQTQSIVLNVLTGKQIWVGDNTNRLSYTDGEQLADRYLSCDDNGWLVYPDNGKAIAGIQLGDSGSVTDGTAVQP